MRLRVSALALSILAAAAATAAAQLPSTEDDIVWSSFVGGPGRGPSRVILSPEPGTIDLGESPWRCGYARARHAAIGTDDWSVQRVLACQRDEATVSATASCRIHDGRVEEHAATLSLGSTGGGPHVTVTLGCRPR